MIIYIMFIIILGVFAHPIYGLRVQKVSVGIVKSNILQIYSSNKWRKSKGIWQRIRHFICNWVNWKMHRFHTGEAELIRNQNIIKMILIEQEILNIMVNS